MPSGSFRQKKVNYTQVSNTVIHDKTLSLKAKGLYSVINSYITIPGFVLYKKSLKAMCIEKDRAFQSTWNELKDRGYLIQHKLRDKDNKFYYEYELLDEPQAADLPVESTPLQDGTMADEAQVHFPGVQNSTVGNFPGVHFAGVQKPPYGTCTPAKQGVYNNTEYNNTEYNNTQSINHSTILQQIDYDILLMDGLDKDVLDNCVDVIETVLMSNKDTYKILGADVPSSIVKKQFMKLNSFHIRYVIDEFFKVKNKINNPMQYLISMLYTSVCSLGVYYSNLVNVNDI